MDTELRFGEWLEDLYLRRGMTQGEFAEAINVGQSTVSSWVNGNARPRRRAVPAIAAALGVDEQEVLERAGLSRRRGDPTLEELRSQYRVGGEPIELNDPLVAFSAVNYDKLTEDEKRLLIETARQFIRARQSGGEAGAA